VLRSVRRFFANRRKRRVVRDFDQMIWMLDTFPELRKHVRKVLRVRGYEQ
jgi:hypothetical protein